MARHVADESLHHYNDGGGMATTRKRAWVGNKQYQKELGKIYRLLFHYSSDFEQLWSRTGLYLFSILEA